jgi:glycerol-3-phosphate O-acyltransferase / dihydroxyacetone phosphate acyltransferase
MLYPIVRPLAAVALKVFFRKIYLSNTENIPKDKPVIIAANHPTAFMEPCILACFLDRPLYFLVRGDIFVKSFYIKMLKSLNMLPVYRMKDRGYKYVRENYTTFDSCYDALSENKTIVILAEGRTIHEKRLRPLQKGTARLAFGALEKYPGIEDVYIVPTGVNYTYADRFRSEVMIDFGKAMRARDFWDKYQANQVEAITELTDDLRDRLQQSVIIIEQPQDEQLTEQLFMLRRSELSTPALPIIISTRARLEEEMEIAGEVGRMLVDEKEKLRHKVGAWFSRLKELGLEDRTVLRHEAAGIRNALILAISFLPFLSGYVLNYLPLRLARFIADSRVSHIEFYSSVMLAVGLVFYLLYFLLLLTIALIWGNPWGIAVVLAMPFLGIVALWWRELFAKFRQSRKFNRLSPSIREDLLRQRMQVRAK